MNPDAQREVRPTHQCLYGICVVLAEYRIPFCDQYDKGEHGTSVQSRAVLLK